MAFGEDHETPGRFEKEFIEVDELGRGEFGRVLKARYKQGSELFAIKKSKSYIELRKIDNARQIAQILQENGGKNKLYLDTQGLGLNVNANGDEK